ncbi:hypothetical protein LCGC14_1734900, partial [marine sediment metagenome]
MSNELLKLSWRAREVLGAEACFMRLGFHEDQVAIACQPVVLRGVISHDMAILVVLQVDDKAFVYVVDPVSPDEPRAKIKKELVDAKRAWNRATQDQRDEILSAYGFTTETFLTEETIFAIGYHRGLQSLAFGDDQVPLDDDD